MEQMTSERLKRWKCLFCGCKDKNIVDFEASDEKGKPTIKIVTCENCGHTDLFAVSAKAAADFLTNNTVNRKDSIEFKENFHIYNHNMPSASKPYHSSK